MSEHQSAPPAKPGDVILDPADIRRSRIRFIALVTLFFGPMLAAWLFVRFGADYVDIEPNVYGTLIQPVVVLEPFQLSGEDQNTEHFWGMWTLLYPVKGECDQTCAEILLATRQVRTAMAKDMGRIQRVVLWQTDKPEQSLPLAEPERHPALRAFSGDKEALAPLWDQLPELAEQSLFLIDPRGNVLMRYSLDFEGKPLLKELRFLLKHSVLG
ncbi:MAG: hypothetical protein JKY89_09745 [Immundisolibacteraceae bacterium]|nr:hypothetical protein [Immundisolibacteraceae bacterium]